MGDGGEVERRARLLQEWREWEKERKRGQETETEKELYIGKTKKQRHEGRDKTDKGRTSRDRNKQRDTKDREKREMGGMMMRRNRDRNRVKGTDRCRNGEGTEDKSGEAGEMGQEQTTVRTRC